MCCKSTSCFSNCKLNCKNISFNFFLTFQQQNWICRVMEMIWELNEKSNWDFLRTRDFFHLDFLKNLCWNLAINESEKVHFLLESCGDQIFFSAYAVSWKKVTKRGAMFWTSSSAGTHIYYFLHPDKKFACIGEVLCRNTKGKFTCSTDFLNFTMIVSEISFILRLEEDLMQLWALQKRVCVCSGIRYAQIFSSFTEHCHLGLSLLMSGVK